MRFLLASAVPFLMAATPVLALEAGDSMQDWAAAPRADKETVLRKMDSLAGGSAARDKVLSCLDDTVKTAGHGSLPISEVAKACSDQSAKQNI